jgi:hypothetical protein
MARPGSDSGRRPNGGSNAADLEKEMLRRGMLFEVIDWTNGQAELPLE